MLKNLKTHCQRIHPGLKVKFKSLANKNVMDLFKRAATSDSDTQQVEVSVGQGFPDDKPTQEVNSKRELEEVKSIEKPPKKAKTNETLGSNCGDINKELLEQILKTVTSKWFIIFFYCVI